MSSLTETMTVKSPTRASSSQRLVVVCYLTAISVATLGWLSAFGWIAVRIAKWLWT